MGETSAGCRRSCPAASSFYSLSAIRWLSLLTLALVAAWAFAARYAGRQFAALEAREEAEQQMYPTEFTSLRSSTTSAGPC